MLDSDQVQRGDSTPSPRIRILWEIGVTALTFSVLFLVLLRTYADPDLWGHLRFGLDILAQRSLIYADSYSYLTASVFWINHEWLAEVLMAIAWLIGQSAGLIALRIVLLGLTFGVIFLHLARFLRLSLMPSLAVVILTVPGLVVSINVVRPQLFTFLLFAVTLFVIYRADQGRYRWLWIMPIVVAVWVNLHGGFLAGGGMLGLWAVLHLSQHPRQWRPVLLPLLSSGAALLINPYGITLVLFLLETGTVARPGISDWQPVQPISQTGAVYLMYCILAVIVISTSRRPKRWSLLILFMVAAVLPLTAVRHLPLMAITFTMFIGEHVADLWERLIPRKRRIVPVRRWIAGLPLLLATLIPFVAVSVDRGKILLGDAVPYPQTAIALLTRSGFEGNLATFFDWGEFIIWHAGPQIQVSIDGRRETVYPDEIYQQHFNFWYGSNNWDALLTEHPTDAVLIVRGTATDNLLRLSPGWLLVYEDDFSVLYINESSGYAHEMQASAVEFQPPERSLFFP